MRYLISLCGIAMLLSCLGCGRTSKGWSVDDSQRAAAALSDSLLQSRWKMGALGADAPSVAMAPLTISLGPERVDPAHYTATLRGRLIEGGLTLVDDVGRGDFTLRSELHSAQDDYGDQVYLLEASLVARDGGAVAWSDSIEVRKDKPASPKTHGKASNATDRKQPGDSVGSFPGNKATNNTVTMTVTKAGLSETQLITDLAALRRVDGVRSIQETMDERGTGRLVIYVLPHRELEVRKRLADMGWAAVRY